MAKPDTVTVTIFVSWSANIVNLWETLQRYDAHIIEGPIKDMSHDKGMPMRIAFRPGGWQRFCTERGLNRPAAMVLNR